MWSRDIIDNGAMWKVGNGETIRARKYAWISSLKAGVITSNVSFDSNVKFKELINEDNSWDMTKLNDIALPFEVQAIQCVHIEGPYQKNSRYWMF